MKRILLIGLIMITVAKLYAQTIATTFFPQFVSYSQKPVVNYGDEIAGSPWNDPCVLKEKEQYIMYTSGVQGGLNHPQ